MRITLVLTAHRPWDGCRGHCTCLKWDVSPNLDTEDAQGHRKRHFRIRNQRMLNKTPSARTFSSATTLKLACCVCADTPVKFPGLRACGRGTGQNCQLDRFVLGVMKTS